MYDVCTIIKIDELSLKNKIFTHDNIKKRVKTVSAAKENFKLFSNSGYTVISNIFH